MSHRTKHNSYVTAFRQLHPVLDASSYSIVAKDCSLYFCRRKARHGLGTRAQKMLSPGFPACDILGETFIQRALQTHGMPLSEAYLKYTD